MFVKKVLSSKIVDVDYQIRWRNVGCVLCTRKTKDFNPFMAKRGNNGFTPHEGFDVLQNNFGISTVIAEGYKAMWSHGNSNFEESSEYKECGQESSASDLAGS